MPNNIYCDRCFKKAVHKPYCDDCIVYFMSKSIFYKIDCRLNKYYIKDPLGCYYHTCKYTNCNKFVLHSSYCEKHTPVCKVCSIKLIDNYTIESGLCFDHQKDSNEEYYKSIYECEKIDCHEKKFKNGLCKIHSCSFAICKEISVENGKCEKHQENDDDSEDIFDNPRYDTVCVDIYKDKGVVVYRYLVTDKLKSTTFQIEEIGNYHSANPNEKTEETETKEKIIKKEVEVIVCSICMNKAINTILNCGHTGCKDCLSKLKNCHCCRENINSLKPIYF